MLTVWEQLQLHASVQVEVLEIGQLPEAFGEWRVRTRMKCTAHLLGASPCCNSPS